MCRLWQGLQQAKAQGLTRAIGVSDMNVTHLKGNQPPPPPRSLYTNVPLNLGVGGPPSSEG